MNEAYLIIQTGYEGIESLDFLTVKADLAIEKLKQIHTQIEVENERGSDTHYWSDTNNFIQMLHRIQGLKDFYCIQKWDGENFDCVCSKLGQGPSKLMLR
jgi:hypothetical protein